jgi:mono/diheme cytochrome c family protein
MRKLTLVLTLLALVACNRDRAETNSPDSGANQNVLDTAASGTAIPDATATDVTLPIGGSPADAEAVTESMAEATATGTTTTAEPPKDTAPAPTNQIADGQTVFRANCTNCHGADGKKPVRGGKSIVSPETQGRPDAELARVLREAPMHRQLTLDDKQVAAVVAYVKALK